VIGCVTNTFPFLDVHTFPLLNTMSRGDDQGITTPRVSCAQSSSSQGPDIRGAHPDMSGTASVYSVGSKDGGQGVSIFDMGLSLIKIMNMIWRSLHHQQTLTTMALSALQLGGPFAQY
jgi:hypothetical protein